MLHTILNLARSLLTNLLFISCNLRFVLMSRAERLRHLNEVRVDPHFKGAVVRSLAMTIYDNQKDSKERRLLVCKEIFITMPVVIYVKKNFYLLDALNEKIEMLVAAGLINFWHFKDLDKNILKVKDTKLPQVLTLNMLMGCFYLLMIGCCSSFVFFIIENLHYKAKVNIFKLFLIFKILIESKDKK